MNEKQRAALRASIRHWEKNLANVTKNERPYIGAGSCECCRVFDDIHLDCTGCPIAEHVGLSGCLGTPWRDVHVAFFRQWRFGCEADWTKLIPVVQKELDFLRSVLETDPCAAD